MAEEGRSCRIACGRAKGGCALEAVWQARTGQHCRLSAGLGMRWRKGKRRKWRESCPDSVPLEVGTLLPAMTGLIGHPHHRAQRVAAIGNRHRLPVPSARRRSRVLHGIAEVREPS